MALPALTHGGELPLGVHAASVREILDWFGTGSAQRSAIGLRLDRVCRVARETGQLARFVVFGSFVTSRAEPKDVDGDAVLGEPGRTGGRSAQVTRFGSPASAGENYA